MLRESGAKTKHRRIPNDRDARDGFGNTSDTTMSPILGLRSVARVGFRLGVGGVVWRWRLRSRAGASHEGEKRLSSSRHGGELSKPLHQRQLNRNSEESTSTQHLTVKCSSNVSQLGSVCRISSYRRLLKMRTLLCMVASTPRARHRTNSTRHPMRMLFAAQIQANDFTARLEA